MNALPGAAEEYLRQLRMSLADLPPGDREDLIAELRSHLEERAANQKQLLAGFPPAETYAAAFLAERSLAGALAKGTPWAMFRSLWMGGLDWAVSICSLPLWFLQVAAVTLVVCGVAKPFCPANVGLFVNATGSLHALGWLSPPSGREVLGYWAIPLFTIGGAALFLATQLALRAIAGWRLRRLRARRPIQSTEIAHSLSA